MRQRWKARNSKSVPEIDVHHGGILFVEIGYQLCPTQPLHECPPESARHQSKQNGNDWQQRTFPIVQQEAKTRPSLLSTVSITQIAPTLQRRGSPGLLQLEDERNYWQLKQKHVLETGRRSIAPTKVSLPCSIFHPKQTRNPHGATLVCSRKGEPARFPQPRQLEQGQNNRSTYRFQEGDATDGTSCEPSGPCKSTRQFPSSETQRNTMKTGTKRAPTQRKKEDLTTRLSPSSLRPVSFK